MDKSTDGLGPMGQTVSKGAPQFAILRSLLADHRAVLGIVGHGYVGLPLALAAQQAGFRVLGFDVNPERVEAISAGEQVISYIEADVMRQALSSGRFAATVEFDRLSEADAILVCVPTPVTRNRDPDLSFVRDTATTIFKSLRPGQLVVLESTTWPGTTREVVQPILESGGVTVCRGRFLASFPPRQGPPHPNLHNPHTPQPIRPRAHAPP